MGRTKKQVVPEAPQTPRDKALNERLERLRLRSELEVAAKTTAATKKRRRFFDAL